MIREIFFVTFLGLTIFAAPVWADKPIQPHSYVVKSSGGRFIFAMLAPKKDDDNLVTPEKNRFEALGVRNRYPISGLYLNDDSVSPIWSVTWYSPAIILPSDGIHLIRQGPWASSLSDEALTFFANGKELRTYQIKNFVDSIVLLPHTASHFEWEKDLAFNEKEQTLTLVTLYNDRYVFNITTGEVISSHRSSRTVILIALGGLACVLLLVTLAYYKVKSAIIHKMPQSRAII